MNELLEFIPVTDLCNIILDYKYGIERYNIQKKINKIIPNVTIATICFFDQHDGFMYELNHTIKFSDLSTLAKILVNLKREVRLYEVSERTINILIHYLENTRIIFSKSLRIRSVNSIYEMLDRVQNKINLSILKI